MASALSTSISTSRAVHCLSPSQSQRLFAGNHLELTSLVLPRPLPPRFTLAFSRRRSNGPGTSPSSPKKKKKSLPRKDVEDEDDPFEALFSMLEEDLKNDDNDDDNEIDEKDMDKLASELAEALGDIDMEMFDTDSDGTEINSDDAIEEEDDEEKEEEEEEEEEKREVKLKNWQLRKLAYALKTGRRKVSVKSLAAELCLDRPLVLDMLRDPPPDLLMLSATLPDEPTPVNLVNEEKHAETVVTETTVSAGERKTKVEEPVHARQHRWSAKKRLKKVHVKTLEMVYRKSKRPTDAMVSSIVQVTNLPRRRIVQWFEDKRAEEGVIDRRKPYQRSNPESVFSG